MILLAIAWLTKYNMIHIICAVCNFSHGNADRLSHFYPVSSPLTVIFRISQVLNPAERLGCEEMGGYGPLKSHPFFEGIDWEKLTEQTAPVLMPYLPAKDANDESFWSKNNVSMILSYFMLLDIF